MKAPCALKGLRKTDLSRATRGSAKTSMLAILADISALNHFSTSCVSYLDSHLKDNTSLLQLTFFLALAIVSMITYTHRSNC